MNSKTNKYTNIQNSPLDKQTQRKMMILSKINHVGVANLHHCRERKNAKGLGKEGECVRQLGLVVNSGKNNIGMNRCQKSNNSNNTSTDKNIDYTKRFDELLRICQSLSNRQLQLPNPKPQHQHQQPLTQSNSLSCTDQTIETILHAQPNNQHLKVLKQRQRCVKSSRSYHQFDLDLPEIKEKQYECEFEDTEQDVKEKKQKNIVCLTERINSSTSNIHKSGKELEQTTNRSSQNLKTSRIAGRSSGHKSQDRWSNSFTLKKSYKNRMISTQITPFDRMLNTSNITIYKNNKQNLNPNKSIHLNTNHTSKTKIKVNIDIDVKKLLTKTDTKTDKLTQNRKIYSKSSMNYYNRSCHA